MSLFGSILISFFETVLIDDMQLSNNYFIDFSLSEKTPDFFL